MMITLCHFLKLNVSELNVSNKIWYFKETSNKLPNGLFGANVYNTLESLLIIIMNNIALN